MENFETTNSVSKHVAKCTQCSNTKQLQNKLHDLQLTYDTLQNKYKTTKLENTEYVMQIDELKQQNAVLESNQKCITEKLEILSPILEIHKSTMDSITEERYQTDELEHKLDQSAKSIQLLQSENENLQKENETFRTLLELNYKQKEMQNIMLNARNKTIDSLRIEIHELRDQLQTVASDQCITPETPKTPPMFCTSNTRIQTLRVNAPSMKTIDGGSNNLLQLSSLLASSTINLNCDGIQFVDVNSENPNEDTSYENDNIYEKLINDKLQKLMMENKALRKQVHSLEKDSTDECKYVEEVDGKFHANSKPTILEEELEFSGDDMVEMEQLFWKCETEMMKSGYDVYKKVRDHTRQKWLD